MAYEIAPLLYTTYTSMVRDGADGGVSPFLPLGMYDTVIGECKRANLDPRLVLAWLRSENSMATNISESLLGAHNAAGIKYVGQERASSGALSNPKVLAPANENFAPYCVFANWNDFFYTLIGNIQWVLHIQRDDLNRAAWYYTLGNPGLAKADAGIEHAKAKYYRLYCDRAQYPDTGGDVTGVYGEDLIALFEAQIGHSNSGNYDQHNGDHPWAYYCRAGVESTGRNCGLEVPARLSALDAQMRASEQGLLQQGEPEHGSVVQFDKRFYSPDGHTGFWNADRGQLLGTLTDGTGVGYRQWGPETYGYAGWYRLPGVVGTKRSAEVVPPKRDVLMFAGVRDRYDHSDVGIAGGNLRLYRASSDPLQTFGQPLANEHTYDILDERHLVIRRATCQEFERGIMEYNPDPKVVASRWDVTNLPRQFNVRIAQEVA